MYRIPFIAVEGPIGIGKTSLAKAISEHFSFRLLKEIVDENPFLGKFYTNIEEWSFQTEMFFLCNRYKQLGDIKKNHLQHGYPVVADYHIFKNLIFAKRTLKDSEYEKYLQIYRILTADMPQPNIVIYLRASLETLLKRIQIRGREIEKNMQKDYLRTLSDDYDRFMSRFESAHPDIPVLRFDGDQLDFVQNKSDLQYILFHLEQTLQKGVHTNGAS
ncbi:deoxyguanosine kinase [Weizmannia acidilactici]|uniref:Deoxyguanosine kinase n=1 Tax=Weizmannia acidilactici TaxID=2607726 RepID=A0A5J4JLW1_9BACI|nr:deoxynucleoside kinase [Weizmannia acidilactici]GER68517.1 deoxyguanosine kinase [Weizmannia acidilactici]GER71695.1 deoxyguanosine kinase [Weizmannia acidilactici]GER75134.1 deoxyguanosine kinase [Weizmannia acidilactici]